MTVSKQELAKYLDSTVLKPESTLSDIQNLCTEAAEYNFKSVCVSPIWVPEATYFLQGTDVLVCTVVGFPQGASAAAAKANEAAIAVEQGAQEIDMVISIGKTKSGAFGDIEEEVRAIRNAIGDVTLKSILETAALTTKEIQIVGEVALEGGADFLKTSTGFGPGNATEETVAQLVSIAHPVGKFVKASGGIRDTERALLMISLGADRIGTSSAKAIVDGLDGIVTPQAEGSY